VNLISFRASTTCIFEASEWEPAPALPKSPPQVSRQIKRFETSKSACCLHGSVSNYAVCRRRSIYADWDRGFPPRLSHPREKVEVSLKVTEYCGSPKLVVIFSLASAKKTPWYVGKIRRKFLPACLQHSAFWFKDNFILVPKGDAYVPFQVSFRKAAQALPLAEAQWRPR
jgi:hypothetical protein